MAIESMLEFDEYKNSRRGQGEQLGFNDNYPQLLYQISERAYG